MGRPPAEGQEPKTPPERRTHPRFRSWLGVRLSRLGCEYVERHLDRFEVLCSVLRWGEVCQISFRELGNEHGYADHLLRETTNMLAKKTEIVTRSEEVDGVWWGLGVNPFADPLPREPQGAQEKTEVAEAAEEKIVQQAPPERSETPLPDEAEIALLYRRACDAMSHKLGKVTDLLDLSKPHLQGDGAACILDAYALVQEVQQRITRLCAAGIRGDPAVYLVGLLNEWRDDHAS